MPSYATYSTPELFAEHALLSRRRETKPDDKPVYEDLLLLLIEEEMHDRSSYVVDLTHGIAD